MTTPAILQNGNKISVAIASAAAVTIAVTALDPSIALTAVTGFFAFLGGMVMGHQL